MTDAPLAVPAPGIPPAASTGPAAATVAAARFEVARASELGALLRERPAVLPVAIGDPVRPLALGSLEALVPRARPEITRAQLKQALRAYCLGMGYLLAQGRPGAWRYDLDGAPVEPVSEDHAATALTRFKGVRAHRDRIRATRRAAEAAREAPSAGRRDDGTAGADRST